MPLASLCRQRGIAARGDVKDLELSSHAHAFRVGRTAEPPVLSGRACLKREKPLNDLGDLGLFGRRACVQATVRSGQT